MDLSQYTDEELKAIANGGSGTIGPPPPSNDFSMYSDEELKAAAAGKPINKADSVVQEMHPQFTAADRLVVKNFSNNNEAAVNYLQKRHPNLEIKVGANDEIMARSRDGSEKDYRVLDPNTGILDAGIGENVRDVGDVLYDVASGIGTSAATAAGGIAGAGAGGVGAIPGAMAAGGAAGAGLEGLKQSLGKALGVGDFSGSDLAIAGGAGAVSPLLFGTGATAAQAAKAGVTEASQKGVVSRAASKFFPWLGEKASGVPATAIDTLANKYDDLVKMEKDPLAITKQGTRVNQSVGNALRSAKKEAYRLKEAGLNAAEEAGTQIDLTPILNSAQEEIAAAEMIAQQTGTEAAQETVRSLKNAFNRYFTRPVTEVSEEVAQVPTGVLDAAGRPVMKQAPKQVEQVVQKPLATIGAKAADKLSSDLNELAKNQKLPSIPDAVGTKFSSEASKSAKEVASFAQRLKSQIDSELSNVLPPGTIEARRVYGDVANTEKLVKPWLKPGKIDSTLRNLSNPSNQHKLEVLSTLDSQFNTGVIDEAKLREAYKYFAKAGALPLSSGGVSGLARSAPLALAGSGLGYYLGRTQGEGSGYGTGLLGGAAGAFLGGPAAIRAYTKAAVLAGKKPNFVMPAATNAWLNMGKGE